MKLESVSLSGLFHCEETVGTLFSETLSSMFCVHLGRQILQIYDENKMGETATTMPVQIR